MSQDNSLFSKIQEDLQQLEENINLENSRAIKLTAKLKRRFAYHQHWRILWLLIVVLASMAVIYPVIRPLFEAVVSGGNLMALTLISLFFAALCAIFVVEKVDDE